MQAGRQGVPQFFVVVQTYDHSGISCSEINLVSGHMVKHMLNSVDVMVIHERHKLGEPRTCDPVTLDNPFTTL